MTIFKFIIKFQIIDIEFILQVYVSCVLITRCHFLLRYTAFLPYRGFYDIAFSRAISTKIGRHFEKFIAAIPMIPQTTTIMSITASWDDFFSSRKGYQHSNPTKEWLFENIKPRTNNRDKSHPPRFRNTITHNQSPRHLMITLENLSYYLRWWISRKKYFRFSISGVGVTGAKEKQK